MLSVTFKPEYVATIFGYPITNTFLTSVLVSVFLIVFAALSSFSRKEWLESKVLRVIVLELLWLTDRVTGDRELSKRILPLIATFFLFIVTANLLALLPGFLGSLSVATSEGKVPLLRSPNSDLTTTLALALVAVGAIHILALKTIGTRAYLSRFFSVKSVLHLFLGFFELFSEAAKVLSFSFRLFGNIFAGEVLLLVVAFLLPYVIPVPFMALEVFVGVVQAFVFAMLTLAFFKTSIAWRGTTPGRVAGL